MSRLPSRFARGSRRAVPSHPAVAGYRPAAAALAVAAAFGLQTAPLRAQPVGGQAIAGQASFARNGSNLVVTTQNAAGSNHSAINWQSFSVPTGSVTRFNQPTATSTSINRVLGPDPSSIFGTLSSNGRLVLVNPAGIAVGAGAVVDTAGFTASTLGMSEADAIAGRMRFAGNGGALQVDGTIVARSGDVFLFAPNVQTGADAVVQSANGATVLAAGQKVEITGRGLEGIRLAVQAPENKAVNLGTLQGDAVGIFAGTLKHSGLVQARAVTAEGGKVLLRAQGDNLVSGAVDAAAASGKGGGIDVLGERVGLLAGAALDASGAAGGGQVRVGGDYQGLNPDVVNAKRTYVDAQASIKADATWQGDGGRVIVWSDETTRMHGQISARGGPLGGDGGFAEASGKRQLQFTGRADLRAPRGQTGTLLLDPEDVDIIDGPATGANPPEPAGPGYRFDTDVTPAVITDGDLNAQLAQSHVQVTTSNSLGTGSGGMIRLNSGADVNWTTPHTLSLYADKGIQLDGTITATNAASGLSLQAMDGGIAGTSVVQVGHLFAFAHNNGGGAANAGKVQLTGANLVDTIAGQALGPGNEFTFNNAKGLTVGMPATVYASGNGVQADDGTNRGPVTLTTSSGALKVQDDATVQGGKIVLTASNPDTGDLLIGNTVINANDAIDGSMSLTAGRNIEFAKIAGGTNYPGLYAIGDLTLNAAGSISLGERAGATTYGYTQIRSNNKLSITAGQDVNVSSVGIAEPYPQYVYLYGNGGPAGGVVIQANAGSVDFRDYSHVQTYRSPIDVTAGTSILGNGDFSSQGSLDGWIQLTAAANPAGSIHFGNVNSNGSYSIVGGKIKLLAKGDITGDSINSNGGYTFNSTASGKGGDVEVESLAGNITILGSIYATGGSTSSASSGSPAGGMAGNITLLAKGTGGTVTVNGDLNAWGANGRDNSGGAGGVITVEADGKVQLRNVDASGGQGGTGTMVSAASGGAGGTINVTSNNGDIAFGQKSGSSISVYGGAMTAGGWGNALAAGGAGGAIALSAKGQVLVTNALSAQGGHSQVAAAGNALLATNAITVDAQSVDITALLASGGDSQSGAGGNGGAVSVQAVGQLLLGHASVRGGNVTMGSAGGGTGGSLLLASATADVTASQVDASGGWGPSGGNGGAVTIVGAYVAIPFVSARGGGQDDGGTYAMTGSGNGGHGGAIVIESQNTVTGNFDASGADGRAGNVDASNGGIGGNGGQVTVTQTAGNFSPDGLQLFAQGGAGGSGFVEFSSSTGGAGGNGGTVTVYAPVGSVGLSGATLSASAGAGGTNGDGSTQAPDGAVLGMVGALARDNIDTSGANLYLGLSGFTARAGGNIISAAPITTRGGAVLLSAGDPSLSPLAGAALTVNDYIDTTEGGSVPGGAITLASSGSVLVDVQMPLAFGPTTVPPITGGPVTITAPDVTIVTGNLVAGTGVEINADTLDLQGAVSAGATGAVNINALTAGRTIRLGGTDESTSLNLTQAELDQIQAGTLTVGSTANTGTVFVETPVALDDAFLGQLRLLTGGSMRLDGTITSGETGDAVVLAAHDIHVGASGGLATPNGRWLAYIHGPLGDSSFGPLVSGNKALWNRTYAGSPPGTVSEPGNRYLFAVQPSIAIAANSVTKVYDATLPGTAGFTATPTVDANAYGNVFLQDDAPTVSVKVLNPTKNVGNYAIVEDSVVAPAGYVYTFTNGVSTITPRPLTVTVTTQNKVYDATTAATATVFDDHIAGDSLVVSLASAKFADKNAGTGKTVNLGAFGVSGADAGNYTLTNAPTTSTADIARRALQVSVSAMDKVYDATTAATATASDDRIAGDAVAVTVSASFADKNVGVDKTVNLGYALGGADAGNYMLAAPATATADIKKRPLALTATAKDKVYDATTAATAIVTDDHLAGDSLSVGFASANFSDKNVGIDKTVTLAGFTLGGADAGNYSLSDAPVSTTADIGKRPLAISVSAKSRTYNATTLAETVVTDDHLAGDTLAVTVGSANFSDKNVGTAKPVSLGGITLSGADAGNYALANAPTGSSADITPAPVTVQADNLFKEQGATLVFNGTEFTASGLQGGETIASVSLASPGAPSEAVSGAYVITPSAAVGANGFLAGNYAVTYLNGVLAVGAASEQQQVLNQVVVFSTLFVEQAKAQDALDKKKTDFGKDDIVVTDAACKPS